MPRSRLTTAAPYLLLTFPCADALAALPAYAATAEAR